MDRPKEETKNGTSFGRVEFRWSSGTNFQARSLRLRLHPFVWDRQRLWIQLEDLLLQWRELWTLEEVA
jgi:hypothetical protein